MIDKFLLGEIAESQTGPFGSQLHEEDYVESGTPIVTVEHLGELGFTTQNLPFVSDKDVERLKKYTLEEGDIVFSRVGAIDRNTLVTKNENGWMFSGRCIRVRCNKKKVNPIYLSYYFRLEHFKKMMLNVSVGATMPSLNTDIMDTLPIELVSRTEQDKIALCLNMIDDKIRNNNSICSDLECMAKLLYDYWFVQFDFPDENGKPYKSSGGKMVWNEDLKREIPAGWEVGTVNDIVNVSSEKITLSQIGSRVYVPIEAIPRNKMSFSETADIDKAATGLCQFEEKAILLSNRRVYFHKVSISPFDGITRDTVIIMYPKKSNNLGYVYQVVNSNHFIEYATHNSYGTEQPVLATPTALEYKFPYPINSELDIRYSLKVQSMIDKVLELQKENMQLASLRDFLLPMLMNGQVKVG